jgi:hypothetical protein
MGYPVFLLLKVELPFSQQVGTGRIKQLMETNTYEHSAKNKALVSEKLKTEQEVTAGFVLPQRHCNAPPEQVQPVEVD